MLDAMADAVAAKGYADTTVADVVAGAGVSRKTFYEHFADKQECFLAAYDAGVETLLDAILEARAGEPDALMRAQVRAYLSTLSRRPAFARTFMLGVFAAGERALERRAEVHRRFEQLLADLHARARRDTPELPNVPDEVYTAAVGAINELVSVYVREGRTADLLELEDAIVDVETALLAPSRRARTTDSDIV
jgi:AcrR family transcriptional regulator